MQDYFKTHLDITNIDKKESQLLHFLRLKYNKVAIGSTSLCLQTTKYAYTPRTTPRGVKTFHSVLSDFGRNTRSAWLRVVGWITRKVG